MIGNILHTHARFPTLLFLPWSTCRRVLASGACNRSLATAFPSFLVDVQEERRKRSDAVRCGKFGEALGLGSHSIERRETRFCVDNTLRRFTLPIEIYLFTKTYRFREYKLSKILEFSQRRSQRRSSTSPTAKLSSPFQITRPNEFVHIGG